MFVNPFDVMEVDGGQPPSYPEAKKASKKALLKFKLSDTGAVEVGDARIERADFIKAVDALSDEEKLDYYYALHHEHGDLNRFLTSGDSAFFYSDHQASLFKHEGFQRFVSSSFADQFGPLLARAVDEQSASATKALLSRTDLLLPEDKEKAYKPASRKLTIVEDKIRSVAEEDEQALSNRLHERSNRNDTDHLERHFNVEVLNVLPPYFESNCTGIAKATRQLGVRVFNELDDLDAAMEIINLAASIDATAIAQRAITKSKETLTEIKEERAFAEKYKDKLQQWGQVISSLNSLAEDLQSDNFPHRKPVAATVHELVDVDALNSLPGGFNDLRQHVAFTLRNLSVAVWNYQEDMESAFSIIETAKKIDVLPEAHGQLEEDFQQLKEMRQDRRKNEKKHLESLAERYHQLAILIERIGEPGFSISDAGADIIDSEISVVLSDEIMAFILNASDQSARSEAFRKAQELLMTIADVLPQCAMTIAERLSKTLCSKSVPIDFEKVIDRAEQSQKEARGCLVFGILVVIAILILMFAS